MIQSQEQGMEMGMDHRMNRPVGMVSVISKDWIFARHCRETPRLPLSNRRLRRLQASVRQAACATRHKLSGPVWDHLEILV